MKSSPVSAAPASVLPSRLGIEPDLILLGKSIAGGVPLGAVVGRKALMDNLPKGGLGGTYSGNPSPVRRRWPPLR
jgi:4-aminobutyrate aminotransferase-like enzyme